MRYPAANWRIRTHDEFAAYSMDEPSNPLEAELCVQFSREVQADGCFFFFLGGKVIVYFKLSYIFTFLN